MQKVFIFMRAAQVLTYFFHKDNKIFCSLPRRFLFQGIEWLHGCSELIDRDPGIFSTSRVITMACISSYLLY